MAPHSSTLAWKIPWMEEPGRLQSLRSLRVGHDWATSISLSLSCIGEGNGNPLQYFCLENPRDREAWWAEVHGVAKSRTWLGDFTFPFTFMHWRRKWQPTPAFLPGESQGERSLVGCRRWGHTESDTTEVTWQRQQQAEVELGICHFNCNLKMSIGML